MAICTKCGAFAVIGPKYGPKPCNCVKSPVQDILNKFFKKKPKEDLDIKLRDSVRPPFEKIYLELAHMLSERSTCKRLSVGCVVTSIDYTNVYGIGYNGNAKGFKNTCDSDEPGQCGCLHAEENALLKVNIPAYVDKIAFITHQPCAYCAKRLINKGGFRKVYYSNPYRLPEGLEILNQAGIETILYDKK